MNVSFLRSFGILSIYFLVLISILQSEQHKNAVDDRYTSPYYDLAKLNLEGKKNKIRNTKALIKISYVSCYK